MRTTIFSTKAQQDYIIITEKDGLRLGAVLFVYRVSLKYKTLQYFCNV